MTPPRVTVLCGGFGAARFLAGVPAGDVELTCVVNTGDDAIYAGLHVSPDVDTVCYALAGRRRATVAVTPVVSGQAPATAPERSRARVRHAFMAARGLEHRAAAVARLYGGGVAPVFVLDHRDAAQRPEIEALGLRVVLADTLAPRGLWAQIARAVPLCGRER